LKRITFSIFAFISTILISAPPVFASDRGLRVTLTTSEGNKIDLYKDSYALIIGNSNYTNGWDPIAGAIRDVTEVAKVLENHGFNITLKTDLTRQNFNRAMSEFSLKFGKEEDNRLLFYFAGHGYTRKMATGEELGYLVMVDAPLPNKDPIGLSLCSVDMQSIVTQAKIIYARHVLFMFDSCFSGSIINMRESVVPKSISDNVKYPVRQFITAGRANEAVPDQSVFKQAFLDLIEGRDNEPIPDNYITGEELGLYLKTRVPEYNPTQHPQYGKIRDPRLDKGDFVFALKLPVQSGQPDGQRPDLEAEKKRVADEAAIVEHKQRELEEIKALIEKKKTLLAEVHRLEMEKKTLEEKKHKETETQAQEEEKQKLAYIPKEVNVPKVSLRRKSMMLTVTDIANMLEKYSFFDSERQPFGHFTNDLIVDKEDTITDRATGLMWQKSGSMKSLLQREANLYVKKLNKERFAGYTDWRLPTVEELASLSVYSKINGLHINPLFSSKQKRCWTADQREGDHKYYLGVWIVNFGHGAVTKAQFAKLRFNTCGSMAINCMNYVKAVRSVK
jgi:hypothetical protein